MGSSFSRHRVGRASSDAGPIHHLGLHGDRLALLGDDAVQILADFDGDSPRIVSTLRPGWPPGAVSFSPTNRYLLLGDLEGRRLCVYDLSRDILCAQFGGSTAKPHTVFGALAAAGSEEVLLMSQQWEEIEGYRLKDMSRVFLAVCPAPAAFIFSRLSALNPDGDTFFALGYRVHDTMDTLLTLSLSELVGDGEAAARELRQPRRISDHAYRIAVGPCGAEQAVFFRDPEESESPLDEEEEEEEWGDIWNFRGLYVRRLRDGQLVERFEYDAPIKTGAPIFATARVVAVTCPDRVELVPRPGVAGEVLALPCRGSSLDPYHKRVALLGEDGDIEIVEVP